VGSARAGQPIKHFCDAIGTWQTRQVLGLVTIPMGCLGDYELSLESIYQNVLPA